MHIHVGHNMPGYLPESDVMCFDSVADALEALKHELKDQQDFYYEGCDGSGRCGGHPGLGDLTEYCDGSCGNQECECAWCDVAGDVEAALSRIADGDAEHHARRGQGTLHVFSPPEGADVAHWLTFADGDRDACEIAQEQDD
jgi:hypothetical protein